MNLGDFEATPNGNISVNILKSTVDIHLPYIINIINFSIKEGHFSDEFKLTEFSPVFKTKDDLTKENYRPASILPQVPKVFQRIMYHQINDFITDKLSKQKNHRTQNCLISMLEMWKKILYRGRVYL